MRVNLNYHFHHMDIFDRSPIGVTQIGATNNDERKDTCSGEY